MTYAALLSLDPDRYRDPLEGAVRNLVIHLRDLGAAASKRSQTDSTACYRLTTTDLPSPRPPDERERGRTGAIYLELAGSVEDSRIAVGGKDDEGRLACVDSDVVDDVGVAMRATAWTGPSRRSSSVISRSSTATVLSTGRMPSGPGVMRRITAAPSRFAVVSRPAMAMITAVMTTSSSSRSESAAMKLRRSSPGWVRRRQPGGEAR